jgi:hypothetical protein
MSQSDTPLGELIPTLLPEDGSTIGNARELKALSAEASDNRCLAVKIVDNRGIGSLKVVRLD